MAWLPATFRDLGDTGLAAVLGSVTFQNRSMEGVGVRPFGFKSWLHRLVGNEALGKTAL